MDNELKLLIGKDEKIIYAGKPNKKCFIFESVFNPLLPFALLWGGFDFFFIGLRSLRTKRTRLPTLSFRLCCYT